MKFDDYLQLVMERRSNLVLDTEKLVPRETIMTLCELATWAPNHKRTWPWLFAVFEGDARKRLGEVVSDALKINGSDEGRAEKAKTKYLRAPVVVAVASQSADGPLVTLENRYATAAAIQNMLLGATAMGLGSFWSSCPLEAQGAVCALSEFAAESDILGLIYFGWPQRHLAAPVRPAPHINFV
ncbi:MAG: nitroreductase family protein [Ilumatobacteraceae bacterium]